MTSNFPVVFCSTFVPSCNLWTSSRSFGSAGLTSVSKGRNHVACANRLPIERVRAGAVVDGGGEVVLVDDLERHESLAGIREGDGHRPGFEVEHRRRIERVAVHADDRLPLKRGQLAVVAELPEAPIFDDVAEIEVALRTSKVSTVTLLS